MKNEGIRVLRPCTFYSLNRRLKIIVIKLDHLGDFIVSIPALSKLREKFKEADIDIIVGEWNVQLANRLKYFRNIYSYNFLKHSFGKDGIRGREEKGKILSKLESFDIAIDLRRHGDTRFLLSEICASLKVGYKSFSEHDASLDICLHTEIEESGIVKASDRDHMALQLIRLVDSIPYYSIDLPKLCDVDPVATQIAIFPKAGNEAREWPIEYAVELCQKVIHEELADGFNVYLPESQSDVADKFMEIPRVQVHIGLNMNDLLTSLGRNVLAIASNSFGGHISSYLGMPVIAIYSGHEFVSQWGPAFGNTTAVFSKVSCAPCHKRFPKDCPYNGICIKQITPKYVIGLIRQELARMKGRHIQFESRRHFFY